MTFFSKPKSLIAAVLVVASTTLANAAVVDFESSVAVGDTITEPGVTITSDAGETILFSNPFGTRTLLSNGVDPDFWIATFDALQTSVSVQLGDFGFDSDDIFLEAYNSANALIASHNLSIGTASGLFTLSVNGSGIKSVNFGTRRGGIFADNLRFDAVAAVPLPAAMPLMAAGLGLMGLMGFRRKRNT